MNLVTLVQKVPKLLSGKRFVLGLAALSMLHCVESKPLFRAQRGYYQAYPGYKKETAFHFIQGLLNDSCETNTVTEEGIECLSYGGCREIAYGYDTNRVTGQIQQSSYCKSAEIAHVQKSWDEISSVSASGKCIKFNGGDHCSIYTRADDQGPELQEAIQIFLAERR